MCGRSSSIPVIKLPSSIDCATFSVANLPADCINLGQGYMNFPPPTFVRKAAEEALNNVMANHYSHPKGRLRLRQAIKNTYEPLFKRTLDVESEILVTSGANEGTGLAQSLSVHIMSICQANIPFSLPFWRKGMKSSCSNHFSINISHL